MEIGGASGSVNRWLRPDSVRHMSVTTATQRLTAARHETRRHNSKKARETGNPQLTGRFRRWWQVLGSNQRRLSRRFYRPLPLATRATCLVPSPDSTVKDSGHPGFSSHRPTRLPWRPPGRSGQPFSRPGRPFSHPGGSSSHPSKERARGGCASASGSAVASGLGVPPTCCTNV